MILIDLCVSFTNMLAKGTTLQIAELIFYVAAIIIVIGEYW